MRLTWPETVVTLHPYSESREKKREEGGWGEKEGERRREREIEGRRKGKINLPKMKALHDPYICK